MLVIALRPTLILGTNFPDLPNTYRDVEAEEVVPVPHVGDPGLFGRQFEPAGFPKEVADLVP